MNNRDIDVSFRTIVPLDDRVGILLRSRWRWWLLCSYALDPGRCTICLKLHVKQNQRIVARVRRFGPKVVASFVSHATAPGVRCHAAPHSVT